MKISKTFTPLENKDSKMNGFLTGFSLIELILVVAIVAVLAGAMIPAVTSARQRARIAKLLQLVDTLKNACIMYHADTGQYTTESTNALPTRWQTRRLSVVPPPNAIPGWDGPYIERLLTNEDAVLGDRFVISSQMLWDFDLDGDGAIDKNVMTQGNSIDLWWLSESEAKAINDAIDNNVPGDWKQTGKVFFYDMWGLRGVAIYLIGGS